MSDIIEQAVAKHTAIIRDMQAGKIIPLSAETAADQPRDERGQWTDGGGSGGASSKKTWKDVEKEAHDAELRSGQRPQSNSKLPSVAFNGLKSIRAPFRVAEASRLQGVKPDQDTMDTLNLHAQGIAREVPSALAAAKTIKALPGEAPWSTGIRMIGAIISAAEKI
jgi:hypothetical protein